MDVSGSGRCHRYQKVVQVSVHAWVIEVRHLSLHSLTYSICMSKTSPKKLTAFSYSKRKSVLQPCQNNFVCKAKMQSKNMTYVLGLSSLKNTTLNLPSHKPSSPPTLLLLLLLLLLLIVSQLFWLWVWTIRKFMSSQLRQVILVLDVAVYSKWTSVGRVRNASVSWISCKLVPPEGNMVLGY